MNDEDLRARIRAAGTRRATAIVERDAASAELRPLVRAALDRGIGPVEVSRLAGLSRPGLRTLLDTPGVAITPNGLAAELGIDGRTLRQWLRDRYPDDAPGQGRRWSLTTEQVAAAQARWRRRTG